MIVTIIDGTFSDYTERMEQGFIQVKEDDETTVILLVRRFTNYGMTVIVEPEENEESNV